MTEWHLKTRMPVQHYSSHPMTEWHLSKRMPGLFTPDDGVAPHKENASTVHTHLTMRMPVQFTPDDGTKNQKLIYMWKHRVPEKQRETT